jgi:hypothetical protein
MNPHLSASAPVLDITRRLGPSASFHAASAQVEAALDELRAAEASLERQLSRLRHYLRDTSPCDVSETARAA